MTEREYIQSIKAAAEAYIAMIRNPDEQPSEIGDLAGYRHWTNIKEKLSPWTAVELCEAWMEKNGG